ncbi:MAG: PAS domain-containing sensor histidine kinase, partial [Cyanobacteria bacterium REEB65]|nr:PAS domain-containing sensor histidine kinase [Cyanobacteria bacterium REEB65]
MAQRKTLELCYCTDPHAQKHLEAILDAAHDGILIHDLQGRLVFANRALCDLIGYSPSELAGKSLFEIVAGQSPAQIRENWTRIRQGKSLVFESASRHREGSGIPTEVSISPLEIDGECLVIGIIRDIRERKRAQEEILRKTLELEREREVRRLREHVFSSVSHEMRTPLSLVVGYAELLGEKHPDDPLVAGIQEGAIRLSEHVDKVLDYAALCEGTFKLEWEPFSLADVVKSAMAKMAPAFQAAGVKLDSQVGADLPPVKGDARRVAQMLRELLDNALRFTPKGRKVSVKASHGDHGVRIDVIDQGPGISKANQERIWQVFQMVDGNDAARLGG